jgi:hypothetical protein
MTVFKSVNQITALLFSRFDDDNLCGIIIGEKDGEITQGILSCFKNIQVYAIRHVSDEEYDNEAFDQRMYAPNFQDKLCIIGGHTLFWAFKWIIKYNSGNKFDFIVVNRSCIDEDVNYFKKLLKDDGIFVELNSKGEECELIH